MERENGPRQGRAAAVTVAVPLLPCTGKWTGSQVLEVGALGGADRSRPCHLVCLPRGRTLNTGHSHGLSDSVSPLGPQGRRWVLVPCLA